MLFKTTMTAATMLATLACVPAEAQWQPSRPVEFVVTAGAGGGTDQFARIIQAVITKYNLMSQPIVVTNKGGGAGAEGFAIGKSSAKDPHKLIFANDNAWLLPMVVKLNYTFKDMTPVAAMTMDQFLLWVKADAPYADAKSFIDAVKAKPEIFKMGGTQAKESDQTLTKRIDRVTGTRFTYVPFKSGNEGAVQLAGGHIDSNTNNPNENIGQWKAGGVKPLCLFSKQRIPAGPKITDTMSWSDIPLCKDAGIPIDEFTMPRTVFMPADAPPEAVAYYVEVLKQVRQKPEWTDYVQRTVQADIFAAGADFNKVIDDSVAMNVPIFKEEGWIVN